MASNAGGLEDQDGDASDWIELHNESGAAVDLGGWRLTDDDGDLAKWTLPEVTIAPYGYLVVFASGKDRAVAGNELHTNFRLDAAGEYLALVEPDGVTIASEFEPRYPLQSEDVAFGLAQSAAASVTLLAAGAEAMALVPSIANGGSALGDAWRAIDFNDDGWQTGTTGVGFERGAGYESLIGLDVGEAMYNTIQSVFVRVRFDVENPSELVALTLRMKYDDGFVAFLNGVQIASRNAPTLNWDSGATAQHPDLQALVFEDIDVSVHLSSLVPGENVLSIQGLNAGAASNDFLIVPEFVGVETQPVDQRELRYLVTATPGGANVSDSFVRLVGEPSFSQLEGLFDDPFDVTIDSTEPGATLIYTTDGSRPTLNNGRRVLPADAESLVSTTLRVPSTSTIRAAAFKEGLLDSQVISQGYVVLSAVATQPNNPAGFPTTWSGGFPADYGVDPDVVNTTLSGYDLRTALVSIPSVLVTTTTENLFGATGIYSNSGNRGAERPASVQLIYPDGTEGFQIDAGIQMHGNSSRDHGFTPKHPLRLLFKSQYGPSKLRYQVFPDSPVDRFDELLLRGASTDSWPVVDGNSVLGVQRWARVHATYFRDQYMRDAQNDMGRLSGHGIYVHLYLNGLYWGLYNLAERPGDSFNAENFGGEKEDYDVIKDFSEVESGGITAWNQLIAAANSGFASESAYQAVQGNFADGRRNPALQKLLDVENLIDYMILHIYSGAEDWPHHNWWAARRRGPESEGFRFFSWDQEISNDSLVRTHTLFQTRFEDPVDSPSPSFLYGRLMANATFRQTFADRVQELCFNGGLLTPAVNYARWLGLQTNIDHAIVGESARWGDAKRAVPYKREVEWLNEMNWMRDVYWPRIHDIALDRFRRKGLFPTVIAPNVLVDGESRLNGRVRDGAQLELLDPNDPGGVVFYTLDGSDPRAPVTALETFPLVTEASTARVLVPTDGSQEPAWFAAEFDDGGWREGLAAVGYERGSGYEGFISTDVGAEMFGEVQTVYMRVPFELDSLPQFDALTLRMRYDDGYVAYLNGERIAARNAPDAPVWDSGATTQHADAQATIFEDVDVTPYRHLLHVGSNVLAIRGLNAGAGSSDFLIVPELIAVDTSGDVAQSALVYASPLTLDGDTRLRTRLKRGGEWSALVEAEFTVASPLRITELMYHPPNAPAGSPFADEDFEYIELTNTSNRAISLAGIRLTDGVEFDFSAGAVAELAAGQRVLLVQNRAAFASRYGQGWLIAGEYPGRLDNSGEHLRLEDAAGEAILDFVYDDGWQPTTDGGGRSLVIVDLDADPSTWNQSANWTASRVLLGSPGLPEERIAGDANADGRVDLEDLNLVRNYFGGMGLGDVDDDRDVDLNDLNTVRNSFFAAASALTQRETARRFSPSDAETEHRAVPTPWHTASPRRRARVFDGRVIDRLLANWAEFRS